jgi:hypothetical protein
MSADPRSPEWLEGKGIDPDVWDARGAKRYEQGDPSVKEAFMPFLRPSKLGTVTKVVNQCGGWVMPRHAPPGGFRPFPPQLRPDEPVIMDPLPVWHYHGPEIEGASSWKDIRGLGDNRPVYPPEAGPKLAGKPLPLKRFKDGKWVYSECFLWGEAAEAHVDAVRKDGQGDYDIVTGEGVHNGVGVDVVHMHTPDPAKYTLLGDQKDTCRIDLHPVALERLQTAELVYFALEGIAKTDAIISAGACAFGVPSVTAWMKHELEEFARLHLKGKVVLIVCDADWSTNWQVERQALKIRTVLRKRELNIEAHVCAPPTKDEAGDNYHKGDDDFLGAGYELGELMLDGREVPHVQIFGAMQSVQSRQRRDSGSAQRALEALSLYVNRKDGKLCKEGEWTGSLLALKSLFGIRDSDRVLGMLKSVEHCFTVTHGTLETEVKQTRYGWRHQETVFTDRPTIRLNDEYRAQQRRSKLMAEDFWQRRAIENHDDRIANHDERIAALERQLRDQEPTPA